MAEYRLVIPRRVFKEFERLEPSLRERIRQALLALKTDPFPPGKKVKRLRGPHDEFWRLRVGDCRVMYEVTEDEIRVLGIVHRKDLEKWLRRQR